MRSRIATDITTIDQHPTDACTTPRPPGALIEGSGHDSGLSNRWCASDEVPFLRRRSASHWRRVMGAKS